MAARKKAVEKAEAKTCPGCGRCLECGGPQMIPYRVYVPTPTVAPSRPIYPYGTYPYITTGGGMGTSGGTVTLTNTTGGQYQ